GDGDLDMAVPNLIGTGGGYPPALDEMYINYGGTFESNPSWHNTEADNSFNVAFGDYDMDGDPDLVTESGYFSVSSVKLYRNNNGSLATSATWESADDQIAAGDVEWCDIDRDGDLDLVVAGSDEVFKATQPIRIFKNNNGVLATTHYWESDNTGEFNQISFADIDDDGYFEMSVSETGQGSGYERVYLYDNNGGTLETSPSWQDDLTYCSATRFADIDADGDYDLAAGGWWAPMVVYLNDGTGGFPASPDWSYGAMGDGMVCEQICFSDVDGYDVFTRSDDFNGNNSTQLFYVDRYPMLDIPTVTVNGSTLDPDEYCFDMELGWVSLASAPPSGTDNVNVEYEYSNSLDMLVTNWHDARGAILFLNTNGVGIELISFTASPRDKAIVLEWAVDIEPGHQGYNLYRSTDDRVERIKLNEKLMTTAGSGGFVDNRVETGERYDYWLEEVSTGGGKTFGPVNASPTAFELADAWPNPSSLKVNFAFVIPYRSEVSLKIYDLKGRAVAEVCQGDFDAGKHSVNYNHDLTSGVYLYRLEAGDYKATKKIVVK
ncbi:MAG: T9SS type A sorting domain-containing protein, partial [bacterium]|nr:T9SS type A sorting domain-containing protein [bacterium]